MKKMIIGLVVGLMIGMSTSAFAAIGDKVQAIFTEFNYVVNGKDKVLDSPVLVYEGTSYVRTTQIANLLGFDVTYKANSRTIEFNKPEITTLIPTSTPETLISETPTPKSTPSATPESVNNITTPTPRIESTPTVTLSPSPSPVPTPDPKLAMCQALRDKQALDFWAYEQTLNPFSGSSQFKKDQYKAQQAVEYHASGC